MNRRSACTFTTAVAVALALATSSPAGAAPGPKVVSGPSPFAGCAAGAGPGAVNYPNAEVEPQLAIDPNDSSILVGGWQQDRWNDGGAHGLVAASSANGGASWQTTPLPFTVCTPGGANYTRASDPWFSIGPDGTTYAVSISFDETDFRNAVLAATSADGGRTWSQPKALISEDDPASNQFFDDKETVTADPVKAGVAYAVWDRLVEPNGNPRASTRTAAFTGPAMFAKTTDGGRTWTAAQVIVNTGQNRQTIGNEVVVDPQAGTLYDFFDLITPPFGVTGENLAFVSSTDGGETWSAPHVVAQIRTVGVSDPNTDQLLRTGDIIPQVAVERSTGRLYAVWQDSRWSGGSFDEVALSTSADGGVTWTPPVRVNRPTGHAAFNPSVAVRSDGTVGVTYDDLRNLTTQKSTLPTDYWLTTSADHGATFATEQHLAGPFDMLTAPDAEGLFLGDYQGLVTSGSAFRPFFAATNSGDTANRTDIFTTALTP